MSPYNMDAHISSRFSTLSPVGHRNTVSALRRSDIPRSGFILFVPRGHEAFVHCHHAYRLGIEASVVPCYIGSPPLDTRRDRDAYRNATSSLELLRPSARLVS